MTTSALPDLLIVWIGRCSSICLIVLFLRFQIDSILSLDFYRTLSGMIYTVVVNECIISPFPIFTFL